MSLKNNTHTNILPLWLLIIYPMLIALDIYTTYLATPNLSFENNWFILKLNMGWTSIITCSALGAAVTIFLGTKANTFFKENSTSLFHQKKKLQFILYGLLIWWFWGHLIYTCYVIFNNYLSYLYLHPDKLMGVSTLATRYVNYYQKYPFHHTVVFCCAILAAGFITYSLILDKNRQQSS